MIRFVLGVEDLADTRFALSPLGETMESLRVLRDPGRYALQLPWRREALRRLAGVDTALLMALVGDRHAIPDHLTPRPAVFAPDFDDELAAARAAPPARVRRDLLAVHAPGPPPGALADAAGGDDARVARLNDAICDELRRYWRTAVRPHWPQIRLVLEADMTYRARRLATGGARALFAGMHPNLRWDGGVLHIDQMIGRHTVHAAGRGLLLVPSVFAHKPAPPVSADEPPLLVYPSRGVATLWRPAPASADDGGGGGGGGALAALLGAPRARLLGMLGEPLPTVEIARRLAVTPSAVSQHLKILHAAGLVARARDGRHMLYRRSPLGDRLTGSRRDDDEPSSCSNERDVRWKDG
ncbi:ArsR/SmtB family transcription factor [Actinomadura verrucosospora]|uniref:MarR family transcriptional regulator n=1 Tax=Actinomadura verrucosospora TaxID=46165 RepID=A0A7D3VP50_ACTVE|nr:helix-turn-helix domain-containing protein [Actinomadura verrucosospora]QKG19010.1 MarR family transcriptional regulator [Actinomadura verrucosospora]